MAARPHVTVVGLGPAGPALLGDRVAALLASSPRVFLRTRRHPAAETLGELEAFDDLYESAPTFEDVYRGIVERLIGVAVGAAPDPVVYAVPGSPLVAERTVELLRADERVDITVVPALSFLDLAWAALEIDPLAQGVLLLDASAPGSAHLGPGPLLAAQCWSRQVLSNLKLSVEDTATAPPRPVILHHLGLPDQQVVTVDWWELDRTIEPDHLTSVYIPAWSGAPRWAAGEPATEVGRLVALMETLRTRCPWDGAQTHASLMPHLVEECYEVVDALAALDGADGPRPSGAGAPDETAEHLREELGDLLFQIVFHACLADEEGRFDLADVARGVHDKLVHRHPHVFADVSVDGAEQVAQNWEDIKKAEKGRHSVTEGIPSALPALMLTTKLVRKARSVGLDPAAGTDGSATAVLAALEERAEASDPHPDAPLSNEPDEADRQVGEILFAVANLAQRLGVDAEQALRDRALALRAGILEAEGVPDQGNRNR